MADDLENEFGSSWRRDPFRLKSGSREIPQTGKDSAELFPGSDLAAAGWGHNIAALLGNPSLAGCTSLGLCPAGRSAHAAGIAAQLAEWTVDESDGIVLLMEGDLWRPALASLLGAPSGPGLADTILNPSITPEEVIHPTRIPRLKLVPAGRPVQGRSRRTLVTSFEEHFRRLSRRFPSVIVTLPSAANPEYSLFPFSLPEAVLLVVQPQCTSIKDVESASRRLKDSGAELIGTIIDETAVVLTEA